MSEKSQKIRITASSKDVFKLIEFSEFLPNMRIWRKSDILQDQISGEYYKEYTIIYDDPNDYKIYSDSLLPLVGEWVLIKEELYLLQEHSGDYKPRKLVPINKEIVNSNTRIRNYYPKVYRENDIVQIVDRTNVEETNMIKVRKAYSINYESDQDNFENSGQYYRSRFSSDKWKFYCNDRENMFDIPLSAIISCSSEKLVNIWIPQVDDFVYLNKYAEKYQVEYYNTRCFKEIVDPNARGAYGQILEVQTYKAKIMWWRDSKRTYLYDNCDHCNSWFYFSDLIPHKIKPKSPR
jgi:hypothetical protein